MPTWQEIEAAKAAEAAGTLENEARIQTLPPGYIKGFDLTIDGDTVRLQQVLDSLMLMGCL